MAKKKAAPAQPARNTSREGQSSVLLWLPDEHLAALDAAARAKGLDRTALLRGIVADAIVDPCPTCKGTGRAPTEPYLTPTPRRSPSP